jgi:hypothetical protein
MVKLPAPPPPVNLERHDDEDLFVLSGEPLWRVHHTTGAHVVAWNQLRYFGPIDTMRFEPHDPPPHAQAKGVSYNGMDVPTVLAEVFAQTRFVNLSRGDPYLTAWTPTRQLTLLDLTGTCPIRNGASYTINTGRKDHCRAWARAITSAWPDLDGLWHHSSLTGRPMVTLFTPAADTFPPAPDVSSPLSHPGVFATLQTAAKAIGYRLG